MRCSFSERASKPFFPGRRRPKKASPNPRVLDDSKALPRRHIHRHTDRHRSLSSKTAEAQTGRGETATFLCEPRLVVGFAHSLCFRAIYCREK